MQKVFYKMFSSFQQTLTEQSKEGEPWIKVHRAHVQLVMFEIR